VKEAAAQQQQRQQKSREVKRKAGPVARVKEEARKQPRLGELRRVTMADVYARMNSKGVPQLQVLDRRVGRASVPTGQWQDRRSQLRAVTTDTLALSKSEKTWRAYGHWVSIFEAYCSCEGLNMKTAAKEELGALLQETLSDLFYKGEYATGSLRLMVTAVKGWLKDVRRIDLNEYQELAVMLDGFEKKIGLAKQKKPPTTDVEVAAFMDQPVPEGIGMWAGTYGSLKWLQWVAIVCTAWSLFLRKQEIMELQLCDISWDEVGAAFLVRRTKNDMKSRTKTPRMDYGGEQDVSGCMLTRVKEYIYTVHGAKGMKRVGGCTKQCSPAERCMVCPPLFVSICGNKVKEGPIPATSLVKRLRAGYEVLEQAGQVPLGTAAAVSVSSLRRGGTTQASAAGIRNKVLQEHGRWRSERMPSEYNDMVEGDERAVSKALQRRVQSVRKRRLPNKRR